MVIVSPIAAPSIIRPMIEVPHDPVAVLFDLDLGVELGWRG